MMVGKNRLGVEFWVNWFDQYVYRMDESNWKLHVSKWEGYRGVLVWSCPIPAKYLEFVGAA